MRMVENMESVNGADRGRDDGKMNSIALSVCAVIIPDLTSRSAEAPRIFTFEMPETVLRAIPVLTTLTVTLENRCLMRIFISFTPELMVTLVVSLHIRLVEGSISSIIVAGDRIASEGVLLSL